MNVRVYPLTGIQAETLPLSVYLAWWTSLQPQHGAGRERRTRVPSKSGYEANSHSLKQNETNKQKPTSKQINERNFIEI